MYNVDDFRVTVEHITLYKWLFHPFKKTENETYKRFFQKNIFIANTILQLLCFQIL